MMEKLICKIPSPIHEYEIEIGQNLLTSRTPYIKTLASKFAIVTDSNVAPLYGMQLQSSLLSSNLEAHVFYFPSGEQHKTRETKEHLENQFFEKHLGRDTCLIALGGGVVTDMAGYLAATYCRGIPLVMMPTSLLGMVDASIGGKNGVNVAYGKNLLGSIYQPKKVIIDLSTLRSLPKRELSNGFVEMIKHSLVADYSFFQFLEEQAESLLKLEASLMQQAMWISCRIKKEIIEQDEKEAGKRQVLNFGHTVGHALEHLTHYALSHGEAVAIGMVVESHLALKQGLLNEESFNRIERILRRYGIALRLPCPLPLQDLLSAMAYDKKSFKGQPRFIIINSLGSTLSNGSSYSMPIEEPVIKEALEWMNQAFYSHSKSPYG